MCGCFSDGQAPPPPAPAPAKIPAGNGKPITFIYTHALQFHKLWYAIVSITTILILIVFVLKEMNVNPKKWLHICLMSCNQQSLLKPRSISVIQYIVVLATMLYFSICSDIKVVVLMPRMLLYSPQAWRMVPGRPGWRCCPRSQAVHPGSGPACPSAPGSRWSPSQTYWQGGLPREDWWCRGEEERHWHGPRLRLLWRTHQVRMTGVP